MSGKYTVIAALTFLLLIVAAPFNAAAQDGSIDLSAPATVDRLTSVDAQQPAGPMKVERVRSGVLVAPDFKVTRFDGRTSELLGGYGGWLSDKTFFVGAGGYWLAHGSSDRRLGYGG